MIVVWIYVPSYGLRALADDACPGMVEARDVELRSEQRRAVAHRTQPQSRRTDLGERQAFAVVVDVQAHARRLDVQCLPWRFERSRG
jgi:hypothetical protein